MHAGTSAQVKVPGAFGTFCSLNPGSCTAVEALGLVYYSPPADWYTQLVDTPTLYTMIAAADASIANNSALVVASGISDVSIGSRSSICNLTSVCTATLTTPLVAPYSSSQAAACVLLEMGPQGSLLPTQVLPAAVSGSGTTATASCNIEILGAYAVVSYKRALPAPPAVPSPAAVGALSPLPALHSPAKVVPSGGGRLGIGAMAGIIVAAVAVVGGVAVGTVLMVQRRRRQRVVVTGAPAVAAAGSVIVVRSKARATLPAIQGSRP
jgi:hypothetical protein